MNKEYQLDLPELESIVIGDGSFEDASTFELESIVFLTIILIRFTQIEITYNWLWLWKFMGGCKQSCNKR